MGYKLETTALISKENYNTFRIRCIMLILENLNLIYRGLNYLAFTFRGFFTFSDLIVGEVSASSGLVVEEVSASDTF